jgi:type II secretory pathway pseudopilin PulG
MLRARLHRQDGFIREVLWLFLTIAVIAMVVLDGLALFTAYQSVRDDAATAAGEARNVFTQTPDPAAAEKAARDYLTKSNEHLVAFSATTGLDGNPVFTVTASAHADTYVFKLLKYVGLKKWVKRMTEPSATRSSS